MHSVNTSPVGESTNSSNTAESTSEEQTTPAEQQIDDRYNYATARLNFGMTVFNFDDAVKEGDGERILRCWKFFMLIFRGYKHIKYAFAALQLLFFSTCLLSKRLCHFLKWNRTVNSKRGKGHNISLDLRLKHLNNLLKEMLKCLGVTVIQKSMQRCSETIPAPEEILIWILSWELINPVDIILVPTMTKISCSFSKKYMKGVICSPSHQSESTRKYQISVETFWVSLTLVNLMNGSTPTKKNSLFCSSKL